MYNPQELSLNYLGLLFVFLGILSFMLFPKNILKEQENTHSFMKVARIMKATFSQKSNL